MYGLGEEGKRMGKHALGNEGGLKELVTVEREEQVGWRSKGATGEGWVQGLAEEGESGENM